MAHVFTHVDRRVSIRVSDLSCCRTQGSIKGQLVWRGKRNGRKGGLSVVVSSFACFFGAKNRVPDSLSVMKAKCLQGYFKVLTIVFCGYFLSHSCAHKPIKWNLYINVNAYLEAK